MDSNSESERRAQDVLRLGRLWRHDPDDVADVYASLREASEWSKEAIGEFLKLDQEGRAYARRLLHWVASGDYLTQDPPILESFQDATEIADVVERAVQLEGLAARVACQFGEDVQDSFYRDDVGTRLPHRLADDDD